MSWRRLGASWRRLGGDLGASWGVWVRLGWSIIAFLIEFRYFLKKLIFPVFFQCFLGSSARLGGVSGGSWRRLGSFWGRLGGVLGRLGGVLACLGGVLCRRGLGLILLFVVF